MADDNVRSINALSLPHFLKSALQGAGYKTTADLLNLSEGDLVTELSISIELAEDILRQCRCPPGPSRPTTACQTSADPGHSTAAGEILSSTAGDLLSTSTAPRFSTFCHALDDLIYAVSPQGSESDTSPRKGKGKGRDTAALKPGMILEFSGPPGIGKTSLALALATSARLGRRSKGRRPSLLNNEGVEVLLIDTEGALTPDRIAHAVQAVTKRATSLASSVLNGIHLVRIATQVQMVAFINTLDGWLAEHPKVALVVIDTLSFHFRQPQIDMSARRRIMDTVKKEIAKATSVHHCAVVVTTQMATKLFTIENKQGNFDNGDKAILMPQLGELWVNPKTIRIALFRGPPGDELRYAHASTTNDGHIGQRWAEFDTDRHGLPCDIEPSETTQVAS